MVVTYGLLTLLILLTLRCPVLDNRIEIVTHEERHDVLPPFGTVTGPAQKHFHPFTISFDLKITKRTPSVHLLPELDYIGVHIVVHEPALLYPLEFVSYRFYVLFEPVVELDDIILLALEASCPIRLDFPVVVREPARKYQLIPILVDRKF